MTAGAVCIRQEERRKRGFLVVKIEYWFIEWDLDVALKLTPSSPG